MKTEKIVVVTTTFYRSVEETRFKLAEQLCRNGTEAGHAVVVVDGSPEPKIQERLKKTGALVYPELVSGMGPSRRLAFFLAHEICLQKDHDIILWTEAEKVQIVEAIPKIIEPFRTREADIVIPARSTESWKTWPEFQQETEKKANAVYAQATGLLGFDPMHGPVALHQSVAHYFAKFNPRTYGVHDRYIQHYAPMVAAKAGKKLASVVIETSYPPEQKKEEEERVLVDAMKKKREEQLQELTGDYWRMRDSLYPLYYRTTCH